VPWVKTEDCIACGICVEECPVGAISLPGEFAEIDMAKCIRCGVCHDVCPQEAVRHDSEKIPEEVQANMDWTLELLKHYKTEEERAGFIDRIKKHFNKEQVVMEQTLQRLETLKI